MEGALVTLFGYMSYLLADGLHFSPIVANFFCGIVMAHVKFFKLSFRPNHLCTLLIKNKFTRNNMSRDAQHYTSEMFEVFASLSETFVFAYFGMAIFLIDQSWDPALVLASIFICLVARAVHVFPLCMLINIFRVKLKISRTHMLVIWFAGLRGAIAFALSLNVPTTNGKYILSATLGIVLFSVFIQGGLTKKLLQLLKVEMGLDPEIEGVRNEDEENDEKNRLHLLDRYYLKPLFTIAYEPRIVPVDEILVKQSSQVELSEIPKGDLEDNVLEEKERNIVEEENDTNSLADIKVED